MSWYIGSRGIGRTVKARILLCLYMCLISFGNQAHFLFLHRGSPGGIGAPENWKNLPSLIRRSLELIPSSDVIRNTLTGETKMKKLIAMMAVSCFEKRKRLDETKDI